LASTTDPEGLQIAGPMLIMPPVQHIDWAAPTV
jgi:hypothetical protein